TGEHTFSPDADTTRGTLITILYSLEENPSAGNPDFSDVTSDDWYGKAAAWAAEKGIMGGYPDGTFGPNDPVTREQIASILYSYAKYKGYDVSGHGELSGFTDQNQVHDWAAAAMGWATAEGLISGMGGGILAPQSSTTRAQAAVILMNFCEKIAK
ncbi:MAG: S-layer homology domain-containing protein, partial [Lawsonibacter sp.]